MSLFRKKNLDKISSPEELNDYIRVTNPSIWLILGAVIILLISVLIWGIFGTIETKIDTGVFVLNQTTVLYLLEDETQNVKIGDEVQVEDNIGKVTDVVKQPLSYKTVCERLNNDEYAIHVMKLVPDKFYFEVTVSFSNLSDGVFKAKIVTEKIKPITFIFN